MLCTCNGGQRLDAVLVILTPLISRDALATDAIVVEAIKSPGACFNKEVQPTLSLNLISELTYSEMGNSWVFGYRTAELGQFTQLDWLWVKRVPHDYERSWSAEHEITIHHSNSSRQKDVSARTSVNA